MTAPERPESARTWNESFRESVKAGTINSAPVEAIVRTISHHVRGLSEEVVGSMRFLELGCGTGPNLVWLASRGFRVRGLDISPVALEVAARRFEASGLAERLEGLDEGAIGRLRYEDAAFDGVMEACVFQHLSREDRATAFAEVARVLKPGGLFAGYMLSVDHSLYRRHHADELPEDPGSLRLDSGGTKILLENVGLTHFFRHDEIETALSGFASVDVCRLAYDLPRVQARARGFDEYHHAMWVVYAVR